MKLVAIAVLSAACLLSACGDDYGPRRRTYDRYDAIVYDRGQWRERAEWSDPYWYHQEPLARSDRRGQENAAN